LFEVSFPRGKFVKHFCKFLNLFFVLALLAGLMGLAQPVQASAPLLADLWVPNGPVMASLISGSTLYIGGDFTYIGPPTGGFAALNSSGAPDLSLPPVNGSVYAIAADGAGGWYLGGSFSAVGGHPRNNLAHLLADKSLDFAWNPNVDGIVRALLLSGDTLYVGGDFTTVGWLSRSRVAALDASSGFATEWAPNADKMVRTLALSGSTIYVGGEFTNIGGQNRNYLAALDIDRGKAKAWNPNPNGRARTLLLNGTTLYVGGDFYWIADQGRDYLAAFDTNTGSLTSWSPGCGDFVHSLALGGNTLYVGGDFSTIGGQDRNRVAALDATTGSVLAWNPHANSFVSTLAVAPPIPGVSGNTIYAGGDFTTINEQPRNHLAALDATTAAVADWNPNAGATVYALGTSGGTVFAAGSFASIGGQDRNHIAAFDLSTHTLTAWNPNANSMVNSLAAEPATAGASSSTIYAGGFFTHIGGQDRNHIAALSAGTGQATSWNPDANREVLTLTVAPATSGGSASTVYATGAFTTIGGQSRNYLAALGADGQATTWDPKANEMVATLAVAPPISGGSGSTVYVGGVFTTIGGLPRSHIAALYGDLIGSAIADWNPGADGVVSNLMVAGSTIYATGSFTNIGGQPRNHIAALDAASNTATDWGPSIINGSVGPMIINGSTLYVGGVFTAVSGKLRNNIAALSVSTGSVTTWDPDANGSVTSLAVLPGSTIYAGGSFTGIGRRPNAYLAALRDGATTCQSAGSGGSWQASNWSNCGNAIPGDSDSLSIQSGHTITLYGRLEANALTINAGGECKLPVGSFLSLEGPLNNSGSLTQTLYVPVNTPTIFLDIGNAALLARKYFGVTLTPSSGDMGYTTLTVRGNQTCPRTTSDGLINRCYEIRPTTPQNATVRFYYRNAELNGLIYNQLKVWHQQGPGWVKLARSYSYSPMCVLGQPDCWLQVSNMSSYGIFGLGIQVHSITLVPLLRK
jgi:hypothetical protein